MTSCTIKKLVIVLIASALFFLVFQFIPSVQSPLPNLPFTPEITKSEAEWRQILTPEQYHILREDGTEPPFSSPLNDNKQNGTYVSADCGEPLFSSEDKFDSGTGWPSFTKPIDENAIVLVEDWSLGFKRIEVRSKKCGSHLGHVFDDGPEPTGKRYCINGLALEFEPKQ